MSTRTASRTSVSSQHPTAPPQYPPIPSAALSSVESVENPATATTENAANYLDGGYGWVITGCAFILLFQFLGLVYAWGIIQAELARNHLANSLSLSAIGSTATFCLAIGCVPASSVLFKIGPRNTVLCGLLGVSLSLGLAGFSTHNLGGLIFLLGIVFGCAGSLIFLTAYTIPSQFFLRKRGLSTGIASCGAGIGGAAWSLLIQRLIDVWGLAWAFRFLALAAVVLVLPAALLLRPGYIAQRPTHHSSSTRERSIFRSSRYIRILIACFIASYPFFIPPYYIPQYATSVGFTAAQGALYSALFNVASGMGRILFGFLADRVMGNFNAWMLSILIIALSSLVVWPYATGQSMIIFFVFMCGTGSGGFFSLQSSIVAQILGSHRLHSGVSWLEVAESFGYFAGPISAGALLDSFGGPDRGAKAYKPAMYLVGGTTAVAFLLVASVRWSTNRTVWLRV